jgi:septum formation protein
MKFEPLFLASASPRRQELLRLIQPHFVVMPSRAKERFGKGAPAKQAERLATEKASELRERLQARGAAQGWVLGADTIVVLNGRLLGKPRKMADATRMLTALSGKTHDVITGLALLPLNTKDKAWISHERTRVWFRKLDEDEIAGYVRSGEPMDKAGAYGIQGAAGAFVKKINGDYFNVVGLPLAKLAEKLKKGAL